MSQSTKFTKGGGVTSLADDRDGWGADEAGAYRWEAIPWKKAAAALVWLLGVWCTSLVSARLFDSTLMVWLSAAVAQFILTFLESPIWRRRTHDGTGKRALSMLSVIALLFDAAFNLVGTWALVAKIHTLDFVGAIGEMFSTTVGPIVGLPAFLLSAVLACAICAAPERLYFDEQ